MDCGKDLDCCSVNWAPCLKRKRDQDTSGWLKADEKPHLVSHPPLFPSFLWSLWLMEQALLSVCLCQASLIFENLSQNVASSFLAQRGKSRFLVFCLLVCEWNAQALPSWSAFSERSTAVQTSAAWYQRILKIKLQYLISAVQTDVDNVSKVICLRWGDLFGLLDPYPNVKTGPDNFHHDVKHVAVAFDEVREPFPSYKSKKHWTTSIVMSQQKCPGGSTYTYTKQSDQERHKKSWWATFRYLQSYVLLPSALKGNCTARASGRMAPCSQYSCNAS